jgi:hypothetical protein
MRRTTLLAVAACLVIPAGMALSQTLPQPPDPAMRQVLDALASLGVRPLETLGPDEARRQPTIADAVHKLLRDAGKGDAPAPNVTLMPLQIDGPLGKIPLYVYTPADAGKEPLPVLLYFHGGGFVTGSTLAYEASIRALALRSALSWCRSSITRRRSTNIPPRPTTLMPPTSGCWRMRPNSTATPAALRWAAKAPAARWPPSWRKWHATSANGRRCTSY